jgi:hypothetical protein
MATNEGRPNWLSEIIKEKREAIDRVVPLLERKSECEGIVAAIKAHPEGGKISGHRNLADVIWGALGVANYVERDAKRNPSKKDVAPEVRASWFIFDELAVPRPNPKS